MRKKIIIGLILSAVVLVGISLAASVKEKDKKDKEDKEELYRQVRLFSDTLAIIESDYVEDVSPQDLIYGALKGLLSALDPHSQFMDPDTYNELKVDTEGKFGGLGIEITIKDGMLTVITPIEDTPAWKAGVESNDRIVKINNELTRDMTLSDAVKRLRGKPGEFVHLTIFREAEKKILEFKIARDIIKIKDIKEARILEDGIGYIRLVEFRENTPKDIEQVLKRLTSDGMNALILDLRNNPGGLLDVAVSVTEKFVEKGRLIVSTRGRKTSQNLKFISRSSSDFLDLPLVVLINKGSASGSEILVGCLQDYRRAIIMGTASFGKGSVQTVVPLSDGSALRLTTSKYFSPSGRQIQDKGVVPDIIVEEGRIEVAQAAEAKARGEDIFSEIENKEMPIPQTPPTQFDYKTDNQLMRAVDVLKAVRILKGTEGAKY